MGGELTSMNQATCIVYARQFGIRYGSICSISNLAVESALHYSLKCNKCRTLPCDSSCARNHSSIPKEAMEPEPSSTGDAFEGNYLDPDGETKDG